MKPISPLGFIDKKISNVPGKWSKERAKNIVTRKYGI